MSQLKHLINQSTSFNQELTNTRKDKVEPYPYSFCSSTPIKTEPRYANNSQDYVFFNQSKNEENNFFGRHQNQYKENDKHFQTRRQILAMDSSTNNSQKALFNNNQNKIMPSQQICAQRTLQSQQNRYEQTYESNNMIHAISESNDLSKQNFKFNNYEQQRENINDFFHQPNFSTNLINYQNQNSTKNIQKCNNSKIQPINYSMKIRKSQQQPSNSSLNKNDQKQLNISQKQKQNLNDDRITMLQNSNSGRVTRSINSMQKDQQQKIEISQNELQLFSYSVPQQYQQHFTPTPQQNPQRFIMQNQISYQKQQQQQGNDQQIHYRISSNYNPQQVKHANNDEDEDKKQQIIATTPSSSSTSISLTKDEMSDHVDQIINDVVAGAGSIPYLINMDDFNDTENSNTSNSSANTNNMMFIRSQITSSSSSSSSDLLTNSIDESTTSNTKQQSNFMTIYTNNERSNNNGSSATFLVDNQNTQITHQNSNKQFLSQNKFKTSQEKPRNVDIETQDSLKKQKSLEMITSKEQDVIKNQTKFAKSSLGSAVKPPSKKLENVLQPVITSIQKPSEKLSTHRAQLKQVTQNNIFSKEEKIINNSRLNLEQIPPARMFTKFSQDKNNDSQINKNISFNFSKSNQITEVFMKYIY